MGIEVIFRTTIIHREVAVFLWRMAEGFWLSPVSFSHDLVQVYFCIRQWQNEINYLYIKILWECNGICLYSNPCLKKKKQKPTLSVCLYFRKNSCLLFLFITNLRLSTGSLFSKSQLEKLKHKWMRNSDTELQLRGQWVEQGLETGVGLRRPLGLLRALRTLRHTNYKRGQIFS